MYLPHRIRIESRTDSQDETTGIVTESWSTFAVVHAHYRPASVREFLSAGIEQAKVVGAFKVRPMTGLLQSMRIVFGGRNFQIEGVLADPRSGNEYYTLPVSEIANG